LWGAAWVVTLTGLLLLLPARPTFRVPALGVPNSLGYADSRTLIACRQHAMARDVVLSGPIHIVDVPSGSVRRIELPDDPLADRDWVESDEELQATVARNWTLGNCRVSGDFVVAWMVRGDEERVHAWNWRTGAEVLRHTTTGFRGRCLGTRIWLQPLDPRGSPVDAVLQFLDLSSGQRVKTKLPADLIDLSNSASSPDGTFVAVQTPRSAEPSAIQVWDLQHSAAENRRELYTLPDVERFAFSPDSHSLATTSPWTRLNDTQHRRIWRIHDLASGREVVKHEEVRTARSYELPGASTLAFHARHNCVVASSRSHGETGILEAWETRSAAVRTFTPAQSQFHNVGYEGRYGDSSTLRYVYDSPNVIDLVGGTRVAVSHEDFRPRHVSPGAQWAVVDDESEWLVERLTDFLASLRNGRGGQRIRESRPPLLYDLFHGRSAAVLSDDETESEFSPDGRWYVSLTIGAIEIWSLPPARPFGRALLWSLLVPLTAVLWPRLQRKTREPHTTAEERPLTAT